MEKQFTLALWSLAALSGMASAQDTDPAHKNFVAADINSDGSLSFEEFQEYGRKPIGRLDTNDDGLVSLEEFLDRRPVAPRRGRFGTRDNRPPPGSAEATDRRAIATEQAESRFTEMDLSGDGYLSAAEMDEAAFLAMDRNGDGVLSEREMKRPNLQGRGIRGGQRKGGPGHRPGGQSGQP